MDQYSDFPFHTFCQGMWIYTICPTVHASSKLSMIWKIFLLSFWSVALLIKKGKYFLFLIGWYLGNRKRRWSKSCSNYWWESWSSEMLPRKAGMFGVFVWERLLSRKENNRHDVKGWWCTRNCRHLDFSVGGFTATTFRKIFEMSFRESNTFFKKLSISWDFWWHIKTWDVLQVL